MSFFVSEVVVAEPVAWINVPAGAYQPLYGSSNAKKKELIKVSAFEVVKQPVTNKEYLAFVKRHSEWRRDQVKSVFADKRYLQHWKSATEIGVSKNLKEPVVNVSWFAANAYCENQNARLPTTDEWEYLASQDDATDRDQIILAWYSKPNDGSPRKSGTVFEGKLGIHDMYGKIWEWTSDFNSSLMTGESREDSTLSRAMFCGAGAIGAAKPSEYTTFMRFAFRTSLKGQYSQPALGFRCARDKRSL